MAAIDNMLYELSKNQNVMLQVIENTSYNSEPHQLWESIGTLKALIADNQFIIEMVTGELTKEQQPTP